MTAMKTRSMHTMSHRASAGSMDASACYTFCAARTASRAVITILDAMILASIFVIFSLVVLNGLSLVLAVLVQLAVLLVCRGITPKR